MPGCLTPTGWGSQWKTELSSLRGHSWIQSDSKNGIIEGPLGLRTSHVYPIAYTWVLSLQLVPAQGAGLV